jgi:hypothetical protein
MSNLKKVLIPAVLIFAAYATYLLMPTTEIGLFDRIRAAGEINQPVNVYVNAAKGFDRDAQGNIKAFYATDRRDDEALISLKTPGPKEIATAKVVEILGHMHGTNFVAVRVVVVE